MGANVGVSGDDAGVVQRGDLAGGKPGFGEQLVRVLAEQGAPRRIALGVASKRAAGRAWRILPATG